MPLNMRMFTIFGLLRLVLKLFPNNSTLTKAYVIMPWLVVNSRQTQFNIPYASD